MFHLFISFYFGQIHERPKCAGCNIICGSIVRIESSPLSFSLIIFNARCYFRTCRQTGSHMSVCLFVRTRDILLSYALI